MWRLVQIHALTGGGETCNGFCTSLKFFFFTVFTYFLNQFVPEAVAAGLLIIPSICLCSWRDTIIGDHSKIDNLVQVGFLLS
jgi:hypothetical protein